MHTVLTLSLTLLTLVLTAASATAEFSADMVIDSMGMPARGKIYYKHAELARTEMMDMISITKGQELIQLFSGTRKFIITDLREARKDNPMAGLSSFEELIEKNNLKKVGSEEVAGYACDIYEGRLMVSPEQPSMQTRIWYSARLAYPLRHEATMPAPMGTMVSQLENIQEGDQPDHLFTIPDGYTRAASMPEAMGLGGLIPGGADGEAGPSPEEIQQMMEQMMESMGKQ